MGGQGGQGNGELHLRPVQVRTLKGTVTQHIRALDADETGEVVSEARAHGWYDNSDLVDLVLRYGLGDDEATREHVGADLFLEANLAREIWIETLQRFRKEIVGLGRASQLVLHVPRVRRYSFGDLATPGLVGLLSQKLQYLDAEKYLEHFLKTLIRGVKVRGRLLTEPERWQHISSKIDDLLPWYLTTLGFDQHVFDRRPLNLFRQLGERLFVALQLARTLDWGQYATLLHTFNVVLDELLYRSRRLGGLQIGRPESRLPTGMPAFFEIVKPLHQLPFQVCLAAIDDLRTGERRPLSPYDRRLLRRTFETTMIEYAPRIRSVTVDDPRIHDIVGALFSEVAQRLSTHQEAVQRFCHVYREAFDAYLQEQQSQAVEDFARAFQSGVMPDGVLLVEGPSDKIYFSALLKLLNPSTLFIEIMGCGSKDEVVKRYGLMTRQFPFLGSVVAVVDGGARKEYEELTRLSRHRKYDHVFRLTGNEIEDAFPLAVHTRVLQRYYFGENPVAVKFDARKQSMVSAIKKILWERKQQAFDKVMYARQLVSLLHAAQEFPEELAAIGRMCLRLGQLKISEVPRSRSALNLDPMSRDLWQQLQERNLREASR